MTTLSSVSDAKPVLVNMNMMLELGYRIENFDSISLCTRALRPLNLLQKIRRSYDINMFSLQHLIQETSSGLFFSLYETKIF